MSFAKISRGRFGYVPTWQGLAAIICIPFALYISAIQIYMIIARADVQNAVKADEDKSGQTAAAPATAQLTSRPVQQNSQQVASISPDTSISERQSIDICKSTASIALRKCTDYNANGDRDICIHTYRTAMFQCGAPLDINGDNINTTPYPNTKDPIQKFYNCYAQTYAIFSECENKAQLGGVHYSDMHEQCSADNQLSIQTCRAQEDTDQANEQKN